MPHVDDGTLHTLLDGALRAEDPAEADRVRAHLDGCADCRARLEHAAALRDRATDVLAALDAAPTTGADQPHALPDTVTPDFQEVLRRAEAARDPHADGPTPETATSARDGLAHRLRLNRGLAWAATIVIALGTGWMVRDLAGPDGRVAPAPAAERTEARATAGDPEPAQPAESDAERTAAGPYRTAGVEDAPVEAAVEAAEPETAVAAAGAETASLAVEAAATETAEATEAEVVTFEAAPRESAAHAQEDGQGAAAAPVSNEPARLVDAAAGLDTGTDEGWIHVAFEAAEARVGRLLVLPGAAVGTIEIPGDGSPRVRSSQFLPGGVEVSVVQSGAVELPTAGADEVTGDPTPAEPRPQPLRMESSRQDRYEPIMAALSGVSTPVNVFALDSLAATGDLHATEVNRHGAQLSLVGRLPVGVLRALGEHAEPGR